MGKGTIVMFDELVIQSEFQKDNIQKFIKQLQEIDCQKAQQMKATGWKYIKTAQRTVLFIFGEVTFNRRCYRKNAEYRYPVDEYLGLKPHSRFSSELMYQVAITSCYMPYRKVCDLFVNLKNIFITKDTVLQARKLVTKLYQEKDEYLQYMEQKDSKKKKVDILYVEGDGILVKSKDGKSLRTELSHFVVHEGVAEEYHHRKKLVNKHEIIRSSNYAAREELINYIYNHYNLKDTSILVTNSDMGHGYSPYIFKEIASALSCRHEHFWDKYHLNELILSSLKGINQELINLLFEEIENHNKKKVRMVLDTIESTIIDDQVSGKFNYLKNRLLQNFVYTTPSKIRGIQVDTLGIIESQQCKISNRMKNRGMYWSKEGAETMARMVIDGGLGLVRELFFGSWREMYNEYIKGGLSAAEYKRSEQKLLSKNGKEKLKYSNNVSFLLKNIY